MSATSDSKQGQVVVVPGPTTEDGQQLEFVLEGDSTSTASRTSPVTTSLNQGLMTPQGDGESMWLDLRNFSGKIRVRRAPPSSPLSTPRAAYQPPNEPQIATTNEPTSGAESVMHRESSSSLIGPHPVHPGSEVTLPTFPSPLERQSTRSQSETITASMRSSLSGRRSSIQEYVSSELVQEETDETESDAGSASRRSSDVPKSLLESSVRTPSASGDTPVPPPPPLPSVAPMGKSKTIGETKSPSTILPRRGNMHKRMSMRVVAQLSSFSNAQGKNTLHILCASPDITYRRVQELIKRSPELVKQKDGQGQLPLHILGNNSDLVHYFDGQKLATKIGLLLMDAYPASITTMDDDGRMPFTYLIFKWIEWTFEQEEQRTKSEASSNAKKEADNCRIDSFFNGLTGRSSALSDNTVDRSGRQSAAESLRSSLSASSNRFPPVMIFEEVEWCFEMLSYGMDHLGGKPLDPSKTVRPRLAYNKQRRDRENLAQNLASIPLLLKTVLLLESKHTRTFIMDCTAIRRALLCADTIGPWLTSMIRYKKGTSGEVAIDFLRTLSKLSIDDFVGDYRKALPHDEKLFREAKLEVYKAVEAIGDMIPSLLIAGERATDEAVTTPLVWFVMNRRLATPFTVSLGVTDFKLHIVALLSFRQSVLGLDEGEKFFVVFPFMTLSSVIFWIAVHHLVRKGCEHAGLAGLSRASAKRVVFESWNLLDIVSVVLAMWATAANENSEKSTNEFVMALVLGLLWLRMLGFLKIVNEQLATFILALTRMIYDIRFFSVVLAIFVLMFGDMFQLVTQGSDDIDCSADDLDPAIEEFCSRRSIEGYLRTYAIVVGDFELEQYNGLNSITFFWFMTTFLGTIVMLNVLIAIVTISYASSQQVSVILFRRSRAHFLASHETMERFLSPSWANWADKMSMWSVRYWWYMFLRWLMLLTFLMTTLWSSMYAIEMLAYTIRGELWAYTILSLALVFAMVYSLWSTTVFVLGILLEQTLPKSGPWRDEIINWMDQTMERVAKKMSTSMFGIDRNNTEAGEVKVGPNIEVMARLEKLESLLETLLAKQERDEEEEMEAVFEDPVPLGSSETIPEEDDHIDADERPRLSAKISSSLQE